MKSTTSLHEDIASKWKKVVAFIEENFSKKPDLNAVLFLIGIRELGILPDKKFSKDEKTHLLHIANCKVLSFSGYYEQKGITSDGWPVWENAMPLPPLSLFEQENLLKQHIVEYFESEEIITF
jgi:hypothetical protein